MPLDGLSTADRLVQPLEAGASRQMLPLDCLRVACVRIVLFGIVPEITESLYGWPIGDNLMSAFRLSPSYIARYFYHECERYLRYHATPSQARTAQGIPQPERATSLVTQALLDRGYAWEEEVVHQRLQGRVTI